MFIIGEAEGDTPLSSLMTLQVLRKKYPQFGQLHNGAFMQQVEMLF